MEGVTILNVITITVTTWGWSWLGFFLGLAGIALIALPIIIDKGDGPFITLGTIVGTLIIFISIMVFCNATELPPITQYQVFVDESASFLEFNEKYEIIKQEGLIYTVQERVGNGN